MRDTHTHLLAVMGFAGLVFISILSVEMSGIHTTQNNNISKEERTRVARKKAAAVVEINERLAKEKADMDRLRDELATDQAKAEIKALYEADRARQASDEPKAPTEGEADTETPQSDEQKLKDMEEDKLRDDLDRAIREMGSIIRTTEGTGDRGQFYIDKQNQKVNVIRAKLGMPPRSAPRCSDDRAFGVGAGRDAWRGRMKSNW